MSRSLPVWLLSWLVWSIKRLRGSIFLFLGIGLDYLTINKMFSFIYFLEAFQMDREWELVSSLCLVAVQRVARTGILTLRCECKSNWIDQLRSICPWEDLHVELCLHSYFSSLALGFFSFQRLRWFLKQFNPSIFFTKKNVWSTSIEIKPLVGTCHQQTLL